MFQTIKSWTSIRVSGTDRYHFLQGQLTQDMDKIRDGQPMLAGWTNAKGRLLCVAWVLDWRDAIYLLLPAELADTVTQRLRMYVLRADVDISPADSKVWFLANNQAKEDSPIPCFESDFCIFQLNSHSPLMLGLGDLPDGVAGTATDQKNSDLSWRAACISAGLPWVYATTSETFLPQMLNLDHLNAISFSKGCYVGQEIVARTQNLGRIKRRMFGFSAHDEEIRPGDTVKAGDATVGTVVDAICADGDCRLLAVIRLDNINEALQVNGAALELAELPYTVPN